MRKRSPLPGPGAHLLLLAVVLGGWGAAPAGAAPFRRGDANADGAFDLADPLRTLNALFVQGTPEIPCEDAADANDDGSLDISDAVYSLLYLFGGRPQPPAPSGALVSDCGEDPTPDTLGCQSFPPCVAPPGPPHLERPASPTRDGSIELRGTTEPGLQVRVTGGLGPVLATARADGSFVATVTLHANRLNRLFARAVGANGLSSPSAAVEVVHDSEAPFLFIDEPADSTSVVTEAVTVTGRVADMLSGFLGLAVSVNGAPAVIAIGIGTNGTFERRDVPLDLGDNTIVVEAADILGNTATRQLRVTRLEPPLDADHLELAGGNDQAPQPIHATLPEPIAVRALAADGSPLKGKLVTFRVTRSDGRLSSRPGAGAEDRVMAFATLTDPSGLARAYWTLGSDAGCGNNRVLATAAGLAGEVLFCASAMPGPAAQINVGSGQSQRCEAGAPAPERLGAWVNDTSNGIPGVPVTFTVRRGSGRVGGASQTTVNTDATGHAAVDFLLGPEPGEQVVEADFPGNPNGAAVFTALALPRRLGEPTAFRGLVLDNAGQALGGAICHLSTSSGAVLDSTSTADGRFDFPSVPEPGFADLFVDGTTVTTAGGGAIAPGTFPSLHFEVVLVEQAENALPRPVLLPPLDPRNFHPYSATEDTVLTAAGLEGFEMTIHAGSMRLADGTPAPAGTLLSLNQVHRDNIPMPMPDGAAPPFAWTLQPGGARFDPPVEIRYPNMAALPPGAIANFLSFNHDTGRFEIVSTGSVSQDGSSILSDPGSGIRVAGWGGISPPFTVTGDVVNCGLKVKLRNPVVCVGQPVRVEVSAGPTPGTLSWTTDGSPPTGTVSESEEFGSFIFNFDTTFATSGEKTITVFWECQKGGAMKSETLHPKVVELVSIHATVSHIRNPSPCAGVADLDDAGHDRVTSLEDMVANPPLALVRRTKTLTLEAMLTPATATPPPALKWKIRRNQDDAEDGRLPAQPPPGKTALIDTDAQGSFHVYAYCDLNGNNEPDTDEPRKVFNLALVGVEVTSINGIPHPAELVQQGPNTDNIHIESGLFDLAQPQRAGNYSIASVVLTGGGSDRRLGVDDISVIFVQNFRGDSFTCHYRDGTDPSAKTVREVFACDPTVVSPICGGTPTLMAFPVLDSGETALPTGGDTPAQTRSNWRVTNVGGDSSRRLIEAIDSPAFNCKFDPPCGGTEVLDSTTGSNDFSNFLVSFARQARSTYVVHGRIDWTVTVSGKVTLAEDSGDVIWTKGAAAGITATATTAGLPQAGGDVGIMVYGPTSIGGPSLKADAR